MDPRVEGDPTGSRWVGGDGEGCRRRASRRRKASGQSGFEATVVPDRNGVGGCDHGRKIKFLVERVEREGHWWRRNRPERGGGELTGEVEDDLLAAIDD